MCEQSRSSRFPRLSVPDPDQLPELRLSRSMQAVALFVARARAVQPDFQLTIANAQAVAELCVHLDGLPLAIELAAARVKLLPPQALLARLGQSFALLTGGARDAPAAAADPAQHLYVELRPVRYWRATALAASFRLCRWGNAGGHRGALPRACSDELGQILDGVASLIDQSLLRQSEHEGVEPRFIMLETIREYGLEMLMASQELQVTCRAYAMYYLRLAEAAELEWEGPREAKWIERLQQEQDNLRAALGWLLERGEAEMALRLSAALWWFWFECDSFQEGWQLLERALREARKLPPRCGQRRCGLPGAWRAFGITMSGQKRSARRAWPCSERLEMLQGWARPFFIWPWSL